MKKRLKNLGGLLLTVIVLYLHWLFHGKYPSVRWWLITACLIAAAVAFLCGVFFPDQMKPLLSGRLFSRKKKDE